MTLHNLVISLHPLHFSSDQPLPHSTGTCSLGLSITPKSSAFSSSLPPRLHHHPTPAATVDPPLNISHSQVSFVKIYTTKTST
uniref:Uncharacterized protein n=1 Tax=Helianthus annuus TaxID=4232 RepID=A0A251RSI7_HELAN